jgi:hypothetical protein
MSNEPTSCTWAMTESPSPTRLANRAVFWRCVVTIFSPNMNYTRTAGLVVSSLLLGFLMGAYRCNVIILWSGLKHTWHLQTAPFGGPLGCWRDQYSEERVFGMPLAGAPSQGSTCWCKAFFACCARILALEIIWIRFVTLKEVSKYYTVTTRIDRWMDGRTNLSAGKSARNFRAVWIHNCRHHARTCEGLVYNYTYFPHVARYLDLR